MEKFKFIDIFAGAGGLAEGFIVNGFEPLAHIEMNKSACDTLSTRLAFHYLESHGLIDYYNKYLREEISRCDLLSCVPDDLLTTVINETITEEGLCDLFKTIRARFKRADTQIDVLVGGPPCQAYSVVGRSVSGEKNKTDPRNHLYKLYVKFLEEFKPKVFVFENVQGIVSANHGYYLANLKERVEQAGYNMELRILNASDYGVLQNRKRAIIIGIRRDLPQKDIYPKKNNISKNFFVNDLLSDLPKLIDNDVGKDYVSEPTEYCLKNGIRTKKDVITWHKKRFVNKHDGEIYKLAIELWNKEQKRLKYTDVPIEMRTHRNQRTFLDRFKVVAGNKHESQTVLAHLSKDGHYFIHPDICQCRSITVREAARLQSFPDSYFFEGNRSDAFIQIGNAVPPLMSGAIAKNIKEYLGVLDYDNN